MRPCRHCHAGHYLVPGACPLPDVADGIDQRQGQASQARSNPHNAQQHGALLLGAFLHVTLVHCHLTALCIPQRSQHHITVSVPELLETAPPLRA